MNGRVDNLKMVQKTTKRLLDIQYKLRSNISEEEWQKIFSNKTSGES